MTGVLLRIRKQRAQAFLFVLALVVLTFFSLNQVHAKIYVPKSNTILSRSVKPIDPNTQVLPYNFPKPKLSDFHRKRNYDNELRLLKMETKIYRDAIECYREEIDNFKWYITQTDRF